MSEALCDEPQSRLKQIAATWVSGTPKEMPLTALTRSLARFDFTDELTVRAFDRLVERWDEILPPLDECRERILGPAFARMKIPVMAVSAGLSASMPASGMAPLSLGWTERHWRGDGALAAKIRVSAYYDKTSRLYWDFGVAGRNAPPIASLRRGVEAAALIAERYGASLDLTPSHQKAAWLALRLGGRPSNAKHYMAALSAGRWNEVRSETMLFAPARS